MGIDLGATIALTGMLTGIGILAAAFAGAYFMGKSRAQQDAVSSGRDPEIAQRLARVEQIVEATALEIERISEGQRFTTRLLSDRKTIDS